jgi:toxin ParE1/3/4
MGMYRLTTPASKDYVNILAFTIERWGVGQYQDYGRRLDTTFAKLASTPKLGKHKGYIPANALLYRVGSHQVIYRPQGQDIEILRILHIRQKISLDMF